MIWVLLLILALLVAAWVLRPWWHGTTVTLPRRSANVTAYRQRLEELHAEVRAGLLAPEALEQAKAELDARLLAEAGEAAGAPRSSRSKLPVVVVLLALPLCALLGYWGAGSWRTEAQLAQMQADPQGAIENMVAQLAARMETAPSAEGYAMLGRSYTTMGRPQDAARAYAEANALSGQSQADWLVAEGEALALARDRDLQGTPEARFKAALKLEPTHPRALWFAGLAAAQAERYGEAIGYWQTLLKDPALPAEVRSDLAQRVSELGEIAGLAVAAVPAAEAPLPPPAGLSMTVHVTLAESLRGQLPQGGTLYVFAKAAQGPPMPLAVQRLPLAEFPRDVLLDDSMGMMPSLKLSQFDRWIVTARITASGSVTAASGDLEGTTEVTRASLAAPIKVTIDRQIP